MTTQQTIATHCLDERTCEPCNNFKNALLGPNTQVSLDNYYTQTVNMTQTYIIHTYKKKCTEITEILNCKYSKNI